MKKQVVKIIDRSYVNRDVKKNVKTGVKTAEKKVDVEKTETDENSEIEKKKRDNGKKEKRRQKIKHNTQQLWKSKNLLN